MTHPGPLTVADRLDIHELYARYAWALGTGDTEGFVACFTTDAVLCDDVFEEEDRWEGAAGIRTMIEMFRNAVNFPGRQHHVGQILIEGDAERASAKAFHFVTHCTGQPPFPIRMCGYYTDLLVKQEGRWLFKERTIRDWAGPVLKAFPGENGLKKPRKRPPDLQRAGKSQSG